MIKKIFILIFIASSLCFQAFSQSDFSTDDKKFFDQLEKLFGSKKRLSKQFLQTFEPFWGSGTLDEKQKKRVLKNASNLKLKRFRPFPDMYNYFYSIEKLYSGKSVVQGKEVWMNRIEILLKARDNRKVSKFLSFTKQLTHDQTLYKSRNTQWRFEGGTIKFVKSKKTQLELKDINLVCLANKDSSVIKSTSGNYYPDVLKWEGTGGIITWARAGKDESKTYAELKKLKLNLKSSTYNADSVIFHDPIFDYPLEGRLAEKVLKRSKSSKILFPAFESYDKHLFIKNLAEGVDYDGGFSLKGEKFVGDGTVDQPAKLVFYKDNLPFLIMSSESYQMSDERISSLKAKVILLFDLDSITHPGVLFTYDRVNKAIELARGNKGISQSPFFNSFHKIDMYFQTLKWKVDDEYMEMGALKGSARHEAKFESSNYFSNNRYDKLQGIDDKNPLSLVYEYSQRVDVKAFDVRGLSTYMKRTVEHAVPVLYKLMNMGFIVYDSNKGTVEILPRMEEFISARSGNKDFDVIKFDSEVLSNESNARLNLQNMDLQINGIKRVVLSKPHYVKIYPNEERIVLKKNRDISFKGIVAAGNTEFFGKDFNFSYKDFKIDMLGVDSMRIRVFPFEGGNQRRLKSVIEGMQGSIQIDDPFNKSGLDTSFSEYPILISETETYVYYDHSSIKNGIYKRDKFFFKIDPFNLDSLDKFDGKGIALEGDFSSSNIFPVMRQVLTIQDDYSLGFKQATPREGSFVYGQKATFHDTIHLSYKGLLGYGDLNYLTSHTRSKELTFYPDSTSGEAYEFENLEKDTLPKVPDVLGNNVWVGYYPRDKKMTISAIKEPLTFFNAEAKLKGTTLLTPEGMRGRGTMRFGQGQLISVNYLFTPKHINADTSDFKIVSDVGDTVSFVANNVKSDVDFEARKGSFTSNGDESKVEFKDVQYICYMDKFTWFMDKGDIELSTSGKEKLMVEAGLDLAVSNFYSTHPDQDSLNFRSSNAYYDVNKKIVFCSDVPYVDVADARIIPRDNSLNIKVGAKIDPLDSAEILANTITKFHSIYNANVTIHARKDYEAKGFYNYTDEQDSIFSIELEKIIIDNSFQTHGYGSITEERKFKLSPNFEFKGDVELFGSEKALFFKGDVQITHECEDIDRNWISFEANVDPNDIQIPINEIIMNEGNQMIFSSLNISDTLGVYPSYLSMKHDSLDIPVVQSWGFLTYNKELKAYQIASKEKLAERSMPGSFLQLNTEDCKVEGEGELNFGVDYQSVTIRPYGRVEYNTITKDFDLRTSVLLDFFFQDKAMGIMAEAVQQSESSVPLEINKSPYELTIKEMLGQERSDKVISDLMLYGTIKKVPVKLVSSIFLADVKFHWDTEEQVYKSEGNIGIANIGKSEVFKYVKGYVEIAKKRSGDVLSFYIEPEEGRWYFFTYGKGLMQAISSDEEFNTLITEEKEDKRKIKDDKGNKYLYTIAPSKRQKNTFIRKF